MTAEERIPEALAQANDEQATSIFHDSLRRVVRIGLINTMAAEVEMLCGPKVRPDEAGGFRRAGSEPGRVFVNGRKERVTRPRVRTDAVQQECLVHAQPVTLAKLPRKAREETVRLFRRLFVAQGAAAGEEAFAEIVQHVARHNEEAAACLRERGKGLL
ncbi:MAG: transposase, partial [Verrucomicrobia bacterium]|nr:transposase [Verrucomicrobiota bacterium]